MTALVAATSPSIGPVLLAITLGALIAFAGHLTSSRRTVAIGILVIFAATVAMFASGLGVYQRDR